MKRAVAIGIIASLLVAKMLPAAAGIATSKHNLSVSGPGDIRATGEQEICIFCHTPHNASPQAPLWNRDTPGQNYTPYTSTTIDAAIGQPTGASLLCLSCHDGTIALGDLLSRDAPVTMAGGVSVMPARRSNLGTDLSDDHPVSITYSESLAARDGKLVSPATLTGPVKLDAAGQVQCTSCHDPHDDSNGKFLVMSDRNGRLCESCHTTYHRITVHQIATQGWDGVGTDPWPNTEWTTVGENSCYNCHTPHAAAGTRLLKFEREEDNCLVCHNTHVARYDVAGAFDKPFTHPLDLASGVHDPTESNLVTTRHVECQDCHNPHAAQPFAGGASELPNGTLRDVRGITIDGVDIFPIVEEYQLCLRCHGDSQTKSYTNRLIQEPNVRLDFARSNPSFHPVAGPGRNPDVPSLIPPLTTASTIKCISCHSDDNEFDHGPSFKGPHGSIYRPILVRQYITTDPNPESASAYALCYKCHDRNSILGDQSFSKHRRHIDGMGMGGGGRHNLRTPCNVCHDPHGVRPSGQHSGTKLINFDLDVVSPTRDGKLYYQSTGRFQGSCYLNCHGKEHNPCSYGTGGGMGGGCMGGMGGG